MNENEQLNEELAKYVQPVPRNTAIYQTDCDALAAAPSPVRQDLDLCQWQVGPNRIFRPAAKTVTAIPPGTYSVSQDNFGPYLVGHSVLSDNIVSLPDSANIRVIDVIRRFWNSRSRYTAHGLLFKRSVLLWGPPGSGKTVTVCQLTAELIASGGIVVFCGPPDITAFLIQAIRRIEPTRPLIVVYEDIDEIIEKYGEHTILSLLDGEQQTDNLVSLATTNYPYKLGARIVNRPSRFDDRIFVGMPSERDRSVYLQTAVNNPATDVEKWAKDTKGLSIAHLRELVAAVLCLDQDYDDVLSRLRSMNDRPKEVDGYAKPQIGFDL